MKKTLTACALSFGAMLLLASPALAGDYPPDEPTVEVEDNTITSTDAECGATSRTITGSNWQAGSTVVVELNGTQVGSATVKSDGTFSAKVDLPATAEGAHELTINGFDENGEARSVTTTVTCVLSEERGLALTGGNLTVWMVLLLGLGVAGAAALIAGRRRASA